MKIIKYLIVLLLICVGLLIPGEAYQNYICDFSMDPTATFYLQEDTDADVIKNEILQVAKENDVELYFVEEKTKNDLVAEIIIYCNESMREYIRTKYDIGEGKRDSLFSGSSHLQFKDWDELYFDSMLDSLAGYYVVGDEYNIRLFDDAVGDKCKGDIITNYNSDEKKEVTICLIVVWIAIIIVLVIINYYEVVKSKKEMTVKMIMGASMVRQAIKKMLMDISIYLLIFIGTMLVVDKFEGGLFLFKITLLMFIIMAITSMVMSCCILFNDFKKSMSDMTIDKNVLGISYVMKTIVTIVLVFSLSVNLVDSIAYIEAVSQKDIYEKYKGYSYVNIESADVMSGLVYASIFYEEYVKSKDIVAFEWIISEKEYEVISTNSNFDWYLEKNIAAFSEVNTDYKKYAFVPEKYKGTETENSIRNWDLYLSDDYGNTEVKWIFYDEKINMPVQNSKNTPFEYLENPVIFYSSQDDFTETLADGGALLPPVCLNRYFVDVSNDDVNDIIEKASQFGIDITVNLVDVYEDYQRECLLLKRVFVCNFAVSLLMLLIEIILNMSIIKMEYVANRKLLIIKKVLGYPLVSRYKKLYKNTLISGTFCFIVLLIIGCALDYRYLSIMLVAVLLLLIFEMIFITILCVINDKTNIQRTLKNGF